ncbi:Barstar (barnase inhibitor) [Saccharomonospora marina XMU15]|uniref:Barstar (Barnase inhibitor) n=1 Tax=Saccharomonospora marina XMU15 TaxID=882083 RepID=H5X1V7_9PSEU|nr:barstar family protein [Saccharomonospora marina]EHR52026.1 Barstar (barnase inhibitor) [Saccharomonospora marina XMU15]
MADIRRLLRADPEHWLFLFEGGRQAINSAVWGWAESGLTARIVRGRKMRTLEGVFNEFAAALQFPLYFGENRDAFHECIAELEGLPAGQGYVVMVTEPDQLLADEGTGELDSLVRSLKSAAEIWASPVELGEWWDRPAVPFHVVLAGDSDVVKVAARRWSSVGVLPTSLGHC